MNMKVYKPGTEQHQHFWEILWGTLSQWSGRSVRIGKQCNDTNYIQSQERMAVK